MCVCSYRWWWRSFFTTGTTAVYVFLYAAFHYFSRAHPRYDDYYFYHYFYCAY